MTDKTADKALAALRQKIDGLDEKIHQQINHRAEIAKEIASLKAQQQGEPVYYRPEREAQVLRAIIERNPGPLSNEQVAVIFREIMSACLALEQPMKVAFLGPEGTFTQSAALKFFGHAVETVPLGAIDEVFREVESGAAQYGVVPIENSTEGVVNHTLDSFMVSDIKICGEVELRIHQHLLSQADDLSAIGKVVSHQQSLAQCREWLDANLPTVPREAVSSNAEAARIAQSDPSVAAIAGNMAAELYSLPCLISNIEDRPNNTTRFLAIARDFPQASGEDKTSILASTQNKPGMLYRLLEPFSRYGVSLSRIESRPSKNVIWDYVFFIDIDGHRDDEKVSSVLDELGSSSFFIKELGSYPKAVL